MDFSILLTSGVGLVTTITGSVVSWVLARRKYNSEVDSKVISNMKESLDFYKELADDNKARLAEGIQLNNNLWEEVKGLKERVNKMLDTVCINFTCKLRQIPKDVENQKTHIVPRRKRLRTTKKVCTNGTSFEKEELSE